MITTKHQPVMLKEAIDLLKIKANHWYVDATFGGGGHTQEILKKNGKVVGFDYHQPSIDLAKRKFRQEIDQQQLMLFNNNFDQLTQVLDTIPEIEISGVLFDFGTSVDQLTSTENGISFENQDALLDMRLDSSQQVKASDLLGILSAKQLAQLFSEYGGEERAKIISELIVKKRTTLKNGIQTVGQLVSIIEQVKHRTGRLHPATKVFQALRICVNDEISNIDRALPQALTCLKQGRIVAISFHQGEDSVVKEYFKKWEERELGKILTKSVLTPSQEEIAQNPKSRSAKLRAFEIK